MELVIDNRERDLIDLLTSKGQEFTTENLLLGDILFKVNGVEEFVIERKTIQDLRASISDGRNREQKARLLNSGTFSRNRIMYLIEGSFSKVSDRGIPVNTLIGSLINTQLRDGIFVYKTNNLEESANFIVKLVDKFKKDFNEFFKFDKGENNMNNAKYSKTLKKEKKQNMTAEVWFINLLASIPRITDNMGSEIVKKYKTITNLVNVYSKLSEIECELLLSEILYTPEKGIGKERKIGKKASSVIYNYIIGKETEVEE
jgi:ERCC4-type nuclease